ncbi:MAG: ABC transporter ATP-binding protein, partial [Bacteroides sp.]|nr:ABC transporter ATP-binding protein [Bacteroides sp.]
MARDIIQISGLCKSFKDVKAVGGISFKVKEGELFAFLGINGAGKSTTISIICGTLSQDAGSVVIDDGDVDSARDGGKVGVVFQSSVLDKMLSVRDNLKSRAACYGICGKDFEKRLAEISELFDLGEILKRPVGKLSGGQRRRVDIARAMLAEPKILILDEPTTGLDPQTRKNIWEVLNDLRKQNGMTVFLTTHYMEEAADADYVVIIDSGRIAAEGTPLDLKNEYTGDFVTLYDADEEEVKTLGVPYENVAGAYRIAVSNTAEVTELILAHKELFTDYEVEKGKMDDVFLAVTGKK